jgi:hypothetical protein
VAEQLERVAKGQVPPQLRALPEHDADPAREGDALAHRIEPADANVPAARHQDAGEHLDRRRLARTVRTQVADHLTGSDLERDPVHGTHGALLATHPARAHPNRERLLNPVERDHDPVLR